MFPVLVAGSQKEYVIERSLRFRSAYQNRTPVVAGNQTTWTYSCWLKRGLLTTTNLNLLLMAGSTLPNYAWLGILDTDQLHFGVVNASTLVAQKISSAVYRDPSAWYHIVVVWDTTNSVAPDRMRLYVNGVRITAFSSSIDPIPNTVSSINSADRHTVGTNSVYFPNTQLLDGYLTEFNFIDGQALTANSFGEFDTVTGIWKPKRYTGSYGSAGYYLPFNTPSINTNITMSANATAPNGGNADIAKVGDSVYMTTNMSAGVSFTVLQYDFGAPVQMARYFLGSLYFTGGTSTFRILVSNDNITYTSVATIAVTATGTNYSGYLTLSARYIRLQAYLFGTNGTANLDSFQLYTDEISNDRSGNGNCWAANNISLTPGVTYDSMIDTPTPYADGGYNRGNYATWNPLDKDVNVAPFAGNLNDAGSSPTVGNKYIRSTIALPTNGKYYWEISRTAGAEPTYYMIVGVMNSNSNVFANDVSSSVLYFSSNGQKYINGVGTAYGAAYAVGDLIGVAFDADNGTITFYKNNASQGAIILPTISGFWVPCFGRYGAATSTNFGQRPFTYTPPSGHKTLNTYNIPEPTIVKSNQHFKALTWTGLDSGPSRSITGVGFAPDLVDTKCRSVAYAPILYDRVRGAGSGKSLSTATTDPENTLNTPIYGFLSAFGTDGYTWSRGTAGSTVGKPDGYAYYDQLNATYVSWNWKANGATTTTNTAGTISSQVSVNLTAGFSIVRYTGNGLANATIGHGLNAVPNVIITHNLDIATNYRFYHSSLPVTYDLVLNLTNARDSAGQFPVRPTSSVFTVAVAPASNTAGSRHVAYCFSEVAGYSKFGSYVGNANADGPFVYCGFKPAFLMYKNSIADEAWIMIDNARSPSNPNSPYLQPQSFAAEGSTPIADFLSNGFKMRIASAAGNASGGVYVFMAFAQNPFKYSLAN